MPGRWVVFEGLDGAGTTTQANALLKKLQDSGVDPARIFLTAEPTHGPFGELCRQALRSEIELSPETLALAFTADRSHHLHKSGGILERRSQNDWVVMDRYLYSTLAYQDEVDREWLAALCAPFPRPDIVVFLDAPVEICLERIRRRGGDPDLYERSETLERIRRSYQWVRDREELHTHWLTLPGERPADEISRRVWEYLDR